MEEQSADQTVGLRSRIKELRHRIVSMENESDDCGIVALDRRVAKLSERLRQTNWASSTELLNDLAVDVLPESLPAPNSFGSSSDFFSRVDALLGEVGPLRTGLGELTKSTVMATRPLERIRLNRAIHLADLADRMIREARASANHQIALLPAWDAMVRQINEIYASVSHLVAWHQKRAGQVAKLREFYAQVQAGNRPRLQAVTDLAGKVLDEVDDEAHPELLQPLTTDATGIIAAHASNVAHVVAFLASIDPVWRHHRLSLVIAALFMDVGMLRTAPGVLTSSSPLTLDERAAVERHSIESGLIAERVQGLDATIARSIAAHHERLDGSGYPSGLRGDEIPVPARLLAAADVYVAMRSQRAYRGPFPAAEALTKTLAEADSGRLDLERARGLLNLSLYPVGSIVELSTSEIAEVVAPQNAADEPALAAQPFVKILVDRHGHPAQVPLFRNLALRPDDRVLRSLSREELALSRRPEA